MTIALRLSPTGHRRQPFVLLLLLLAAVLPAVELMPPFARNVPADHSEAVYICDLDQHVFDLADWPVFVDALDRLRLRVFYERELRNRKASTQGLLQMLRQASPNLPSELALSAPVASYQDLQRIIRLFGGMIIANGAEGQPIASVRADLVRLQDDMLLQLRGLKVPACRLWLSFSDEQIGVAMLAGIEEQLLEEAGPWGLERAPTGGLVLDSTLGEVFKALEIDESTLRIYLASLGFTTGLGDARAVEFIEAVQAIRLQASLRRLGNALILELGAPAAQAAGAPALADCRVGEGRIAMLHLSSHELAKVPAEMRGLLEAFAGSPLLAKARERDSDDFIGQMLRLERIMRESEVRLDARVVISGGGLRIASEQHGMPERPALAGSGLADFVPAGCGMWWLDATRNPGEALRDLLIAVEDRVDSQVLVATLQGATAKQRIMQAIGDTLRIRLAALRSEILDQAAGRFSRGLVVVADGGETLVRAVATMPAKEGELTIDASGLALPALAVVGACPEPAAVLKRWRELLRGTFGAQVEPLFADADLGLGVPTMRIDLRLAAALVPDFAVELDSGFEPHFAVIPGFLVFSTSPALTRRVLAQRATGRPDLVAGFPPTALARGRVEPKAATVLRSGLNAWVDRAATLVRGGQSGEPRERIARVAYANVLDAFIQLACLLPDISLATDRGGDGWTTSVELRPDPAALRGGWQPPAWPNKKLVH